MSKPSLFRFSVNSENFLLTASIKSFSFLSISPLYLSQSASISLTNFSQAFQETSNLSSNSFGTFPYRELHP